MKFITSQKDLSSALSQILSVKEGFTARMAITADATGIRLKTQGLEMGAEVFVPAEVEKTGTLAIAPRRLASVIGDMAGDLSIRLSGKALEIEAESDSKASMQVDAEDAPEMKAPEGMKPLFAASGLEFSTTYRQISMCTSDENSRYLLQGISFSADGNATCMRASDGRQLVKSILLAKFNSEPVLIHKSHLDTFVKWLGDEDILQFEFSGNNVRVTCEKGDRSWSCWFPVISEIFPILAFDEALKKNVSREKAKAVVDVDPLRSACETVNKIHTASVGDSNPIRIEFAVSKILAKANSTHTQWSRSIPAKCEGEKAALAFNAKYLANYLKGYSGGEVELSINPGNGETDFGSLQIRSSKRDGHVFTVLQLRDK